MTTKRISFLTHAALVTASSLAGQVGGHSPPNPEFGLMGGALGQTVRLNVLFPPGPTLPPGRTRITLGFDVPGFPPGPVRTVDLMPGDGAFLDLPMDRFGLRLGQRIEIQPTVAGRQETCA